MPRRPGADPPQFPVREGVQLSAPNGRRYRLLAYLGGGRTSQVWKAESAGESTRQVAVKIMAPGLPDDTRQQFLREAEILFTIAHAEEKLGLRLDGASLVPTVEVITDDHDPPFFVETLAKGKPIDEILREGVPLAEQDVLDIGEQLCRVFQVLHEELERSYLDFQPRNVFWDEQSKRITVIDWNLLSARGQADVAADLETVARLLYRLSTGEAPARHLDTPERWQLLTAGTQAFLTRALHVNLSRRFDAAQAMRQQLRRLLSWWRNTVDELMAHVARLLEGAKSAEKPEKGRLYLQARQILDIAERKSAEPYLVEKMREEIAGGLADSGALGQGRGFFKASDYQEARRMFDEARSEAMTLVQKLAAWRWFLAADAATQGRGKFTPHRQDVEAAVEALTDWTALEWEGITSPKLADAAEVALDHVAQSTGLEPTKWLADEISAWRHMLRARESIGDDLDAYQAQESGYQTALGLGKGLPYRDLLFALWGDLEGLAARARAQVQLLKDSRSRLEDLKVRFHAEPHNAITRLHDELKHHPGNPELTQLICHWSQELIQQGELQVAKQCLNGALLTANPQWLDAIAELHGEVRRQLQLVHELDWAETEINSLAQQRNQGSLPGSELFPLQLAGEIVDLLGAGGEANRDQQVEKLEKWLRHRLSDTYLDEHWRRVIAVLHTIAPDISRDETADHLRRRGWAIVWQAIETESLSPAYELQLVQAAENLAPGEDALNDLREALKKRGEARQQAIQDQQQRRRFQRHYEAAERLATQEPAPKFDEALQMLEQAETVARELKDPTLIERVQARRDEYLAEDDALKEVAHRKQIEAYRQTAKQMAALEPSPKLDEALEELEQAIYLAQQIGDVSLVRHLKVERRRYEMDRQTRDESSLRRQIKAHEETSQQLARSGLISRLSEAVDELSEAIQLCQQLGDDNLLRALRSRRGEYKRKLDDVTILFDTVKTMEGEEKWGRAINLATSLQNKYGITGKDVPGEIEEWLHNLNFEFWAAAFKQEEKHWHDAVRKARRERSLKNLNRTVEELRRLPRHLMSKEQQTRLNRMESHLCSWTFGHWASQFKQALGHWHDATSNQQREASLKEADAAIQELRHLSSHLSAEQQERFSEMEVWLHNLTFEHWALEFEQARQQWRDATSKWQQKPLLDKMGHAVRDLRDLETPLSEEQQARLNEIEKTYNTHYNVLNPPEV